MTFDNIEQAANALGLDYDHLQTARWLGCPSLRNGRVYGAGLTAWLRANAPRVNADLAHIPSIPKLTDRSLDAVEARLIEIDRAIKAGRAK